MPTDFSVRPIPDSDDLIAFNYGFALEAKSADDAVVTLLDDGDLLIEGFAAEFEGNDRQGENFTDGAFQRGIKSFLEGTAALCFHHKYEKCLGKVLDLKEVEGKGLWMRARVDGAIRKHPELATYYEQIKNGTLTGLSVGGIFKRKWTAAGQKIADMDFTEISVTPVPCHAKPAFSIVAGKALEESPPEPDESMDPLLGMLESLDATFSMLEGKAVKGDPQDLHFLALILDVERLSNELVTQDEAEEGGPEDKRVDALVAKTKDALDEIAREAHSIAAKLGPLPTVTYV